MCSKLHFSAIFFTYIKKKEKKEKTQLCCTSPSQAMLELGKLKLIRHFGHLQ